MTETGFSWFDRTNTPTQILRLDGRWAANDETQLVEKVELLPSPAELARQHRLRVADERPAIGEYLRRLLRYRHFIVAYSNAKVDANFGASVLGRLWQVLTPLTNAAIYYVVFGVVLGTRHGVTNFIAYLCTGLFIFGFTQAAVLSGLKSISGNLGLIRALHFPRASLPLAATLTHMQSLFFSVLVLLGIVAVTGERVTMRWLLVPPALLLQVLFNAGLVLIVARLGAKLADLKQVAPFVMRTWMYGSGVFYSVEMFADHLPPAVAILTQMNPLLVYIELVRHALLPSAPLASTPAQLWLVGAGWAALVLVFGFVYFWRGEREYGRG